MSLIHEMIKFGGFTSNCKCSGENSGSSGGGSGGGASSWEDLGSTYEEGVVLAECTPECGDGQFALFDPISLTVGKEYTVNWNGTQYKCVAQDTSAHMPGSVTLGDVGSLMGEDPTGVEPFAIVAIPEEMQEAVGGYAVIGVALDGSESIVLSITGLVETITKIPVKYIPGNSTGSVFLYIGSEIVANADRYLYNSEDISNAENRLTREQLLSYIRSGRTIYIHDPEANAYYTGSMVFADQTENVSVPYMYVTITLPIGTITAVTAER